MTKKKRSIYRVPTALGCALVLGCTFVLPSCGGSGSSPTTSPTPRPPVRTVILQTGFSGLEPFDPDAVNPLAVVALAAFTTSATGDLDVTVDWTFASNDVDLILARGTLAQALSPACLEDTPECPLEAVADATTLSKPEVLTIFGFPAGSYLVLVVNFGTTTESGVISVGLTS